MTKTQTGLFEVGTYGYPIAVLFSATPDPVVKLTDVGAIALSITRPNATTIARSLAPIESFISSGSSTISDTIRWSVASGDHSLAGRYVFALAIDSETNTKHLVVTGSYFVGASASLDIGPATADQINGYVHTYDGAGAILASVTLIFTLVKAPVGVTGESLSSVPRTFTSDMTGFLQAPFLKGATYKGKRGRAGSEISFAVPTTADSNGGFALPNILGR